MMWSTSCTSMAAAQPLWVLGPSTQPLNRADCPLPGFCPWCQPDSLWFLLPEAQTLPLPPTLHGPETPGWVIPHLPLDWDGQGHESQ